MYCCYKKSSTPTIRFLILLVTLLNFSYCNSQTGPGGVGNASNNALWLKADGGTYINSGITLATNGQQIQQWNDASGNNRHAIQTNTANKPLYKASETNGMPGVKFTGNTFIDGPALGISANSSYTYLMVFKDTQTSLGGMNDGSGHFILDRTPETNGLISLKPITGNVYGYQKRNNAANGLGGPLSTTNINTNTKIIEMRRAYNVNYQFFYNGNQESILTDSDGATTPPAPRIGRHSVTANGGLRGYINEFIIYNFALNTAQTIIVNNYLSAKYDTSLNADDIYTQDNNGAGNFDHKVAGIGQAYDGSNHTDSRGAGIVRIKNPTSLANNEFMFWGEESQNPTYNFSSNTYSHTEQLNSKWRVGIYKSSPKTMEVDVSFDISSMDLTEKKTCTPLQLVIDNDSDFSSPEQTYDLTISGLTAIATGVSFRNNRYFTIRYTDQIVWNSIAFLNGSGVAKAPNNTDSCLKLTIKAGTTAKLTEHAHVREIEVEPGATLNVADGILLEVKNGIDNEGIINLLGDAQLIQNHTGTTANSGSGSLTIGQQGTGNATSYNYWSSPVNTQNGSWQIENLEDGSGGIIPFLPSFNAATPSPMTLSSRWLYTFNGPGDYDNWVKINTDTDLAPGIGYTMKGSGSGTDQEYIFRGTPNDGNYSIPITTGNEILIGNPYPSALDSHEFINNNSTSFDGTLYFWESFTSNNSNYLADYEGGYATYNLMDMGMPAVIDPSGLTSGFNTSGITKLPPTRYVSVGQGFFIKSPVGYSGNIVFNNGQRAFAREILNETVYYKTNNTKSHQAVIEDTRPKLWFSMIDTKGYSKTIGLGYDTNTTLQYDRGYDAEPMDYLKDHMYWVLDNKKLVIQGLPEINTGDILPMAMEVTNPGVFEFSISKMKNVPDDLNIYLLDNEQNIYYNLRDGEAQFAINTKGNQNQFSIVFQEQNVLEANKFDKNDAFVSYNSNSKILELHYTESITTIKNLKFYNTLGQEVKNIKTPDSSRIDISHLTDGVYILNIESKNGVVLKNIKFVKY